jgi:hypothetical protein
MDCGPRCIQHVLAQDGERVTLRRLDKECRLERDGGTFTSIITHVLTLHGYKVWQDTNMEWDAIKELLPEHHVIFGWTTPLSGTPGAHWSIFKNIGDTILRIWDPDGMRERDIPRAMADALWYTEEQMDNVMHDEVRMAIVMRKKTAPRLVPPKRRRVTKR